MDFSAVVIDTSEGVATAVQYILGLDISPSDKKKRIAQVVRLIGRDFHEQLYDDVSRVVGSSISSKGLDTADRQIERLAEKIVRNEALGRSTMPVLVRAYYDSVLGRAQEEAFRNAVSLQKHPELERIVVGETCIWCRLKEGRHPNPSGEDFSRHDGCDCLLIVSGYNTRNGILKNYVKRRSAG